MAILTKSGRVGMAEAMAAQPVFMAWGRGDPEWGESPPGESVEATALNQVIGYRKAARVRFCTPDPEGDIVVSSGRFRISDTPTNHLYLQFLFDFNTAPDEVIREMGIYLGAQPNAGLPPGQEYFQPDELEHKGTLLLLEYRKPLYRDIGVRETFEYVITL